MGSMTQSLEDYIETIYVLKQDTGSACVRDVARALDVKMPSVVKAIHELKGLELVTQQPYAPIELTEKGVELARAVLARHHLLRRFLMALGVSRRTSDVDACRMEHILSAETLDKIRDFTERRDGARRGRARTKPSARSASGKTGGK